MSSLSSKIYLIKKKGEDEFTVEGAVFTVGGAEFTVRGAVSTVAGAAFTVGGTCLQ